MNDKEDEKCSRKSEDENGGSGEKKKNYYDHFLINLRLIAEVSFSDSLRPRQ